MDLACWCLEKSLVGSRIDADDLLLVDREGGANEERDAEGETVVASVSSARKEESDSIVL